jgi:SlyX protein
MEGRLVDLEVRYAHQDKLLEELSAVVYEQRRAIDALEKRVKALEDRAKGGGDAAPPIEPPPHY